VFGTAELALIVEEIVILTNWISTLDWVDLMYITRTKIDVLVLLFWREKRSSSNNGVFPSLPFPEGSGLLSWLLLPTSNPLAKSYRGRTFTGDCMAIVADLFVYYTTVLFNSRSCGGCVLPVGEYPAFWHSITVSAGELTWV
jgi:hypothetical protein